MANLVTLKKRGTPVLSAVLIAPSEDWELAHRCRTWDDADRYRQAIINETQRSARIRWEAGEYLVEWKK
jgi:hypothetical protein